MHGFAGALEGPDAAATRSTPVETGVPDETLDRIADAIGTVPEGFTVNPKIARILADAARRRSQTARRSTGGPARRWRSARSCSKARRSGSAARTAAAARSASGTRSLVDVDTGDRYVPLDEPRPEAGRVRRLRQPALRGRGARASTTATRSTSPHIAGHVGGAVRRLRQRRPGHHRPVHRLGRVEVGPRQRPGAAPAARLRGPGAGALQRPARALPAALRRGQHPGRQPDDAGAVLPPAAPAGAARLPQAADRDDAQEPAAAQAGASRRSSDFTAGQFREVLDDPPANPDRVTPRAALLAARSTTTCWRSATSWQDARGRDRPARAVLPLARGRSSQAVLGRYRRRREWVWVQEESQNMGGWTFVEPRLRAMGFPFEYVGRDASASPATGSHHVHEREQELIVTGAFAVDAARRDRAGLRRMGREQRRERCYVGERKARAASRLELLHCPRLATHRRCVRVTSGAVPMAVEEVKVPAAGESITEGIADRWLKPDGAAVKAGRAALRARDRQGDAGGRRPGRRACCKIAVAEGETVADRRGRRRRSTRARSARGERAAAASPRREPSAAEAASRPRADGRRTPRRPVPAAARGRSPRASVEPADVDRHRPRRPGHQGGRRRCREPATARAEPPAAAADRAAARPARRPPPARDPRSG